MSPHQIAPPKAKRPERDYKGNTVKITVYKEFMTLKRYFEREIHIL